MKANIVQKIGQISVPIQNVQQAIEFYEEKLGLVLLFQTDTMAFFDCNGLRLLLSLPEKEAYARSGSVLYFQVHDIHESYANLRNRGVPFIDEPHVVAKIGDVETWMTFFNDSEGNTHALMSEIHSTN